MKVPLTVGVPEIVPLLAITRPVGSPVALKVYGPPAPPLATIETGVICTPATAVIETQLPVTGGYTTIEQAAVAVLESTFPDESTTCPVKFNVPAVVGVPVIAPVAPFRNKPSGRLPEEIENVYGGVPPVATSAEL